MDWKKYWDQIGNENSNLAAQVQRNHKEETKISSEYIADLLAVSSKDTILDVCCGNGLLTNHISSKCFEIIGIDQAQELIKIAQANFKNKNCTFVTGSAIDIPKLFSQKFDKIFLEFSFQYFTEKNEGLHVIKSMLEVLKPGGILFLGDIPEKGKEGKLYNSLKKKIYHQAAKIKGKDSMGKFWSPEEIYAICGQLEVDGKKITQPKSLPYSHYRFDFIIRK